MKKIAAILEKHSRESLRQRHNTLEQLSRTVVVDVSLSGSTADAEDWSSVTV